ncbi:MAG: HAMP domain-containing histidine kinase [Bryobacterales bacterium]|nr:HAMP domain-containing histidine kinase [Bryobacterales bacterium]
MRHARRIQGFFLAFMLLFVAAVGWLGWRLLDQDRALARQRRLEQLEAAADRVTGVLYRRLSEYEELLVRGGSARLPSGAVLLRTRRGSIAISPPDGLLYQPLLPAMRETPTALFAETEALEFQRNDFPAAAAALSRLAVSSDPAVRAAALVRLGRNLRKARQPEQALEAYRHLAAMGAATVGGLPAELVALEGRCALFAELGRPEDLKREAGILHANLVRVGWRLGKSTYDFQLEQARQWLGAPRSTESGDKEALSAAAELIWQAWRREPVPKGRRIIAGDRPVLAAWSSDEQEWTAVLAPALTFEAALLEAGSFEAALIDGEGRRLLGRTDQAAKLSVERTPASMKLPWTLQVTSSDDGTARLAGRRWLFASGFAVLVSLLAAVSFIVARAVSKEVAVAQLQADFVAAVSHEFRSPLASISQIAELLDADRWPTAGHRRRGCEFLTRETARLRRLVEGLLDFARMEAGKAGYRLVPLDATEMVRSVVEEFQSTAGGSEVRLSVAGEMPRIQGDREALSRALWNLLENAVKYSPPPARISVEALGADGRLAIRVRDEGIGIPASEQEQVFRKFYRGGEAKMRGVKGTGIGLAMVRHIVAGHGGEIRLESAPGRGSTFTLLLPGEWQS